MNSIESTPIDAYFIDAYEMIVYELIFVGQLLISKLFKLTDCYILILKMSDVDFVTYFRSWSIFKNFIQLWNAIRFEFGNQETGWLKLMLSTKN